MKTVKTVAFTLRLPEDIHKDFSKKLIDDGLTIQGFFEQRVGEYLLAGIDEFKAVIMDSNGDTGKILEQINSTGIAYFNVRYWHMGRVEKRTIQVMKYNQNKHPDHPPYIVYSVFPRPPKEKTITFPATESNIFAQFPRMDVRSDEELVAFLRKEFKVR